jgi:hypothetical protein
MPRYRRYDGPGPVRDIEDDDDLYGKGPTFLN